MKHLLAIITILSVTLQGAYAERIFHVSSGLLKEKVTGIVQDDRGFMWFSTWGGLYRYDGHTFRSFKTHPGDGTSMPYDRLDAARLDKNGNIWCRSFYHPYCFDIKTSTFIDVTESLEQEMHQTFNIRQIYPMSSGYVWLQTDDGRAIRVSIDDPKTSARLYSPANGRLKKGKILSINEDSRGMAWILSEGGITVPGSRVTFPNKRFDLWQETVSGCVYLATKEGELWHLNARTWKMRRVTLPVKTTKILRLAGHSNGELLVATDEALLAWHKGKWTVSRYKERIASVKRLFRDARGRYWMITDRKGVTLLPSITSPLQTLLPQDDGNYENKHDSWFFGEQPQNTVLLMARGGGLCCYDAATGQLSHVKLDNGEWYQPQVGRTFVDRENNVWLYNSEGGLDRISLPRQLFRKWGVYNPVCALFMDSKNRLWVGDTKGKLTVWGRELNLGIVYAIEEMQDGTVWVGTKDKGLYRIQETKGKGQGTKAQSDFVIENFVHNPQDKYSISANDVFSMTKDKDGNLWIGTYSGGLNMVNARKGIRFINKNNNLTWLPTDERSLNIRSLLCTKEGIMCVGTSRGIYAFKSPKQVYHHERKADDEHGLTNNEVMMMYQDRQGDVYCLTPSSGICRTTVSGLLSDNAVFTVYDKQNLAPSDAPLSITGDANDNLWIAYHSSIAMLNKKRTAFYNWQSPSMSFAEIVSDGNGELISASTDDIISWNPRTLKANEETPRIAIAALTVAGRQVDYDPDLCDTITLQSNERDVSLQLAALTMRQGEKIEYAYRMTGDSTWITQGDNDRLTFLNMRAGCHTLQVRSTNASGVWCDNVRTMTFYVTPTFWETPWALLLYILIGALAIGSIAVVWAYIYRLRLKMRTQEEVIKQRMNFIHHVAPLIRDDKEDLLERVRKYIDEHISDEDLTIPSMAAEMGMSRATFFTRFKELSGLSPQDYLIHYRIEHARQLLQNSTVSIAEIAYSCGFSDPKYFSRVFKKIEGMSPSTLRAET